MMKFLTDENVDIRVFNSLIKNGFDVKDIKKEGKQGFNDRDVIVLATKEKRILITHDKDFGDYAFNKNIKHSGIILLRFKDQSYSNVLKFLLGVLNSKEAHKLTGNLTELSEGKILIYKD